MSHPFSTSLHVELVNHLNKHNAVKADRASDFATTSKESRTKRGRNRQRFVESIASHGQLNYGLGLRGRDFRRATKADVKDECGDCGSIILLFSLASLIINLLRYLEQRKNS